MQLSIEELQQLVAVNQGLATGRKITTANVASLTANLMYGRGGMFDACVNNQIVNASVQAHGIGAWLKFVPANTELEKHGLITYMGHDPNSEPDMDDECADPPYPKFQGCTVSYCFGVLRAATPQYNLLEQGLRYCEQTPIFRMYGAVTDQFGNTIYESGSQIDSDVEWGMVMGGVQIDGDLCRMIWIGDPANPTLSRSEFKGLQNHIVQTGYWDSDIGVRCPAVDSEVKDFGNDCICDYQASRTILDYMLALKRGIDDRAREAGFPQVDWANDAAWVGPRQMLDAIWDCLSCQVPSVCSGVVQQQAGAVNAASLNWDGGRVIDKIEDQRARRVFRIDGVDIPAIVDDCVPFTVSGSREFGSLYLLVKKIGPLDILFGEYVDLNRTAGRVIAEMGVINKRYEITDGGRFLSWVENKNECFDVRLSTKVRLIAKAPQLLGRIDNICWEPLQHTVEKFDTTSPYALFGGVQDVQPPGLYYGCLEGMYGMLPEAGS